MSGSDKKTEVAGQMDNGVIALEQCTALDDDIEVIRLVKSGNSNSFEILVEKYKSFVFGVIRSVIRNSSIEEDLAQEAFIQAYRGLQGFREDSQFKTWLYRITFNICLSYLRKQKRQKSSDVEIDLSSISDSGPGPDKTHEKKSIHKAIENLIFELPPRYRSILYFYYYDGMQYEQISETTGLPMGTVKSHLHRAREKIKKELKAGGWIPAGDAK